MPLYRLLYVIFLFFSIRSAWAADIFVEAVVTSTKPYVQAQVLYTVRVYYAVNINNGSLTDPIAGNAIVVRLGEEQGAPVRRNGIPYYVVERRYAVLPQISGKLTITPPVLVGKVSQGSSGALQAVRFVANAVTLDVQPKPAGISSHWLPAQMLTLQETWSSNKSFRVGDPITRTFIVNAIGVSGEQLPSVDQSSTVEGINSYPAPPIVKTNSIPNAVTGQRIDKLVLVPTQSGEIKLPSVYIEWWNTRMNKRESAFLPARMIKVLPEINAQQSPLFTISKPSAKALAAEKKKGQFLNFFPWILVSIFLIVSVTFLMLWLRSRREKTTLHSIKKILKKACLKNNLPDAKKAFLQWSTFQWPMKKTLTLGACLEYIQSPLLKTAIQEIDERLYSKKEDEWEGRAFWTAFENEQKAHTQTVKKIIRTKKRELLPPLNPPTI